MKTTSIAVLSTVSAGISLALAAPGALGRVEAQPARGPGTGSVAMVQLPITVPCCRCIDGSQNSIGINTGNVPGSVPWAVSGPGVPGGAIGQTITGPTNSQWTAIRPPAQWINPSSGATNFPGGVYTYTITIEVPRRCIIPMSVVVSGEAAGDDQIRIFHGNNLIGQTPLVASPTPSPAVPASSPGWGFRNERVAPFTSPPLGPGTHVLRIEVTNGSLGPHGLLVRGSIRSRCARDPERGDRERMPEPPDPEVRSNR